MSRTPGSITQRLHGMPQQGFIGSIISLLAGFILGVLAFRFIFRLLGANPDNGIVAWVYNVSAPFVQPFFGMFNTGPVDTTVGAFEIATLVALIVYGVVAAIVLRAVAFGGRRTG